MTQQADNLEKEAQVANKKADKCDCDIRDLQKKISNLEAKYDEASEKLIQVRKIELGLAGLGIRVRVGWVRNAGYVRAKVNNFLAKKDRPLEKFIQVSQIG